MRVAIDSWTLASRFRHFGTYVYTRHLIAEFKRLAGADPELEFCLFASSNGGNDANTIEPSAGFELPAHGSGTTNAFGARAELRGRRAGPRADLLFSPTPNILPLGPVPVISTIHDAIPTRMPAKFSKVWMALRWMTGRAAKWSRAIITDSEWSKKDLVELYGLPECKVTVVYLGCDKSVFHARGSSLQEAHSLLKRLGIHKPYLFHHGKIQPRKNLERLIAAYRLMLSRNKNLALDLVLAGGLGWDCEDVLRAAHDPGPGRVVLTGALRDAEIAALLANATLAVIPTLYEGFCLPLVESMACGTPTIASRASCLPEVSGNALRYFDPLSIDEMAASMEQALEDEDLRKELSRKGISRAEAFSWEQCARETLDIFRRVAQDGRT